MRKLHSIIASFSKHYKNVSQNEMLIRITYILFFLTLVGCTSVNENNIQQDNQRDSIFVMNIGDRIQDSIPDSLFQYRNLEYLNLCCNELSDLDPRIAELSKLKRLDLYHTDIKKFPDVFYSLSNLEELDLTSMYKLDYQSVLPKLHKFLNLKRLNLGCNQMTSPNIDFSRMNNLEEFGFIRQDYLEIEKLLKNMSKAKKLRVIHLSANNIEVLPPEIKLLSGLEELNLFDNKLTELPKELIELKSLKTVTLIDNPIDKEKIKKLEILMPKTKFVY